MFYRDFEKDKEEFHPKESIKEDKENGLVEFFSWVLKNSNHNFLEDKNVPEQKECPIYVILDKNNNIFGIINSAFYDIKNSSLEKIPPKVLAIKKAIMPDVKRI